MKKLLVIAILAVLYTACTTETEVDLDAELKQLIQSNSKDGTLDYYIMPQSTEYSKLPNQDPSNPISKEKVELGRFLFFETGLAQSPAKPMGFETYSCSSCHVPSKGFLPGRIQGIADGGAGFGDFGENRTIREGYLESEIDAQGNRPMTVMNVTYMTNTLWSGTFGANDLNEGTEDSWTGLAEVNHTGFAGLEAQNIEGFDLHRLEINDKVLYEYGYAELFDKAFPDIDKEERYTPITASFAMGSFLRSILTNQAPFQYYLKGNHLALSAKEKKGAMLFFGKAGCSSCHNSPSFSSMNFFSLGTADMYQHGGLNTSADDPRILGRGMFTGNDKDMYKFKVPQLYNLKDYASFFHGSSKLSIEDVVEFKVTAKSENPNVSDERVAISPKDLSSEEKENLIEFLRYGLYDSNMERYMPEAVLSGNCFPNNDEQSQSDMGCK
ncbi:MAG: cytochrome c peroxidase [Saprospiraceae bacterium]|nr:cytochrome c peroxidase [Saprospiraceae bacterium]